MNNQTIETIKQAISKRLQHGFHDGYCYFADEWRLLRVGLVDHQSSLGKIKAYYAVVKIETPDPEDAIAVFEIDGNDPSWGTDEIEEAVVVGDAEGYFPDNAVLLSY